MQQQQKRCQKQNRRYGIPQTKFQSVSSFSFGLESRQLISLPRFPPPRARLVCLDEEGEVRGREQKGRENEKVVLFGWLREKRGRVVVATL